MEVGTRVRGQVVGMRQVVMWQCVRRGLAGSRCIRGRVSSRVSVPLLVEVLFPGGAVEAILHRVLRAPRQQLGDFTPSVPKLFLSLKYYRILGRRPIPLVD